MEMNNPAVVQAGLRCPLCALEPDGLAVGGGTLGTRVIAFADHDVVVLIGPGGRDALVVPRHHLFTLSKTAGISAPALSAMRVVVNVLRSVLGVSGATIEPTLETGGVGHVSFRVVPTIFSDTPAPRLEAMVALLAGALLLPRRSAVR